MLKIFVVVLTTAVTLTAFRLKPAVPRSGYHQHAIAHKMVSDEKHMDTNEGVLSDPSGVDPTEITHNADVAPKGKMLDFSSAATSIFSSYRIPAMLIAGAAYGGTFAMPLKMEEDLTYQLIKRSYVVIGLATVCAELLTVVVSTCAIDKIAVGEYNPLSTSLKAYLDDHFELEWVALRVNFILGLLGFAMMCGLRAWCFLSCPVFSRVSIGIIITSICFMAAMMTEALTTSSSLAHLGTRYLGLLVRRCRGETMHLNAIYNHEGGKAPWKERAYFILSVVVAFLTAVYTTWAYSHVVEYFVYNGLPFHEKVKKGWLRWLHFGHELGDRRPEAIFTDNAKN